MGPSTPFPLNNLEIAQILYEIADLLEIDALHTMGFRKHKSPRRKRVAHSPTVAGNELDVHSDWHVVFSINDGRVL